MGFLVAVSENVATGIRRVLKAVRFVVEGDEFRTAQSFAGVVIRFREHYNLAFLLVGLIIGYAFHAMYPQWDSNPHCNGFKPCASTGWAMGAGV
jgi:hypothetical protein